MKHNETAVFNVIASSHTVYQTTNNGSAASKNESASARVQRGGGGGGCEGVTMPNAMVLPIERTGAKIEQLVYPAQGKPYRVQKHDVREFSDQEWHENLSPDPSDLTPPGKDRNEFVAHLNVSGYFGGETSRSRRLVRHH